MTDYQLFSGAISVKAILEQNKRPCHQLMVNKDRRSKDFAYIIAIAKKNHVPVSFLNREDFRKAYPDSGGIVLEAGSRIYPSLMEDTENARQKPEGLCVYVSGIEDPYNLGSTCRSLYAAGASMLILPRRNWDSAQSVLLRASAGAWEKMEILMCESDEQLKDWSEQAGLPIVCSARDHAINLFEYSWPENCLLVIGGALRGISTTLLSGTEHVYIPYGRDFKNALDTPSAAAVMGFAYTRQYLQNTED